VSQPKKGGLLGKLGRGVTNIAHGIERAAESEFMAKVGREFKAAMDNAEA
jgi:hypothetical protein